MTHGEMFAWIQQHPIAFLATSDKNQPHTRAVFCFQANEEGIVFNTQKDKELFQQISRNSTVEFCFYDFKEPRQVRICGKLEYIEDRSVKQKVLEKMPPLHKLVERDGLDILAPHCLRHGKASIWTRKGVLESKEYIEF